MDTVVITVMKFKPGLVLAALLLAGAVVAVDEKGAANTKVDLSEFDQLRVRHSITLLPAARSAQSAQRPPNARRRLDGENSDQATELTAESLLESQFVPADPIPTPDSDAVSNPDAFSEQQFYEAGTELFLAQEQKRILLLQFYEAIVNDPNRAPHVDPRVLKLMTNYLQTLEYVYTKQVQHTEESPPVLYDYRSDTETAAFCDSPPVALPDLAARKRVAEHRYELAVGGDHRGAPTTECHERLEDRRVETR